MTHFLTIPEEIYLLGLNEEGEPLQSFSYRRNIVIAGAVLMDLALQNRIDTDIKNIIPDNTQPTGDYVLDEVLNDIKNSGKPRQITSWLAEISHRVPVLKDAILTNLIRKGVLKVENQQVLWFFHKRKYPVVEDNEITEVMERIRKSVFSGDIPDFRDIVIISLIFNGDMLELVFDKNEIGKYSNRIEQLAKMDLVGQAVSKSMKELTLSVSLAMKTKELLGIKNTREKMDELVETMKEKLNVEKDEDLPDWLQKGTEQYKKTLQFIEETGTNEIIYDPYAKKYKRRQYGYPGAGRNFY